VPNVRDCLVHAQWLIEHGRGEEKAALILPRVEAQRRRENKEGRTRFIREMDSHETYSEFNAEFDRYVELSGGNPHIAYGIMLRLLRQLPDSSIRKLAEIDHQG
jgi:hypothetical protein